MAKDDAIQPDADDSFDQEPKPQVDQTALRTNSRWHTISAWRKANPDKARALRYRHRALKPLMYQKQMRDYMRRRREAARQADQQDHEI